MLVLEVKMYRCAHILVVQVSLYFQRRPNACTHLHTACSTQLST